jgi:deglycase
MKGRTLFRHWCGPARRRWPLYVAILLGVAVVCWGQQRRTTSTGRTRRPAQLKVIQLPAPTRASAASFEELLTRQQNLQAPTDWRLTFSEIGQLLWAAQGVAVPQSGAIAIPDAMIPMKVYVMLPDGAYLYSPSTHALQQLRDGDIRAPLAAAVLNQQGVPVGGCQILLAGTTGDFSTRYGQRAKTAMLLLAGQMAQSVQLQAVSLDLTYIAVNNIDTVGVRRVCRLDRTQMPLYMIMAGYPASRVMGTPTQEVPQPVAKKAVIITPQRDFQDEELFQTKFALEAASVEVLVASSRSGRVVGTGGTVGQADLGLNAVNIEEFDAVVFIGGAGVATFASNARVQELAKQAVALKKIVAASGTGPLILANAGLLKSARVTGLATQQTLLVLAGAVYTGAAVEKDELLITSTGPLAVAAFARTITEALATQ